MANDVYITGMGIISSLGNSVEETKNSLLSCKSGIGPIRHLKTIHNNEFVAGEVPHTNEELENLAGIGKANRSTLLGMIAATEALKSAGVSDTKEKRTGFISSTTVGGMTDTELVYTDFFKGNNDGNFINSHFSGQGTNAIAENLGITDFVSTVSTACSSAANAIMLAARMIRHGELDRVVAGGTDALSLFTLNGFNTLMILDPSWCKPFDENRKGLNLGEGAAYLVLESESEIKRTGKKPIAKLSGYSNANDAFHQTASSPEGQGAQLAMKQALKVAKLSPEQIDYINAHGTGTPNNDSAEGQAMQSVFNGSMPLFSSTKAYTGHTLAAAASIEAVISLLSMTTGTIFPSLNITDQMKDLSISPVKDLRSSLNLKNVMSNSFGFGGNCSTLIFSNS